MIRLEIADYCRDCLEFEPDVDRPATMSNSDGEDVIMSDTVIKCYNRRRCKGLVRYLERTIK